MTNLPHTLYIPTLVDITA